MKFSMKKILQTRQNYLNKNENYETKSFKERFTLSRQIMSTFALQFFLIDLKLLLQ